jgi:hypothetical protein
MKSIAPVLLLIAGGVLIWSARQEGGFFQGALGDISPKEIRVGTEIELEHTQSRRVAKRIALDHLEEDPRYYTKLCKWHREPACRLL